MKASKKDTRYDLLWLQFQLPKNNSSNYSKEFETSLERIFLYVYYYTDIMYLEFINKSTLYQYLEFHSYKDFKEANFIEAIKDVKNFHYFLKYIKEIKNAPEIDLSINNFHLWTKIGASPLLR